MNNNTIYFRQYISSDITPDQYQSFNKNLDALYNLLESADATIEAGDKLISSLKAFNLILTILNFITFILLILSNLPK